MRINMIIIISCFFRGAPTKMAIDHDCQSLCHHRLSVHIKLASEDIILKIDKIKIVENDDSVFTSFFLKTALAFLKMTRLSPLSHSPSSHPRVGTRTISFTTWSHYFIVDGWRLGGTPSGLCSGSGHSCRGLSNSNVTLDSITPSSFFSLTRSHATNSLIYDHLVTAMTCLRLDHRVLGWATRHGISPNVVVEDSGCPPLRRRGSFRCRPRSSASLSPILAAGVSTRPGYSHCHSLAARPGHSDGISHNNSNIVVAQTNDICQIDRTHFCLISQDSLSKTDSCHIFGPYLYDPTSYITRLNPPTQFPTKKGVVITSLF